MNQLDKIIEITKETLKKSISYRPISSLENDFEKYQKRGFIEAISKKVSKEAAKKGTTQLATKKPKSGGLKGITTGQGTNTGGGGSTGGTY